MARNAGIRHATGDLLYFLDADDWIEPGAIERLVRAYQNHAVQMVCAGYIQDKDSGVSLFRDVGLDCDTKFSRPALIEYIRQYLRVPYRYALLSNCWHKLYILRTIREQGIIFDTRLVHQEDVSFNFRYLRHVDAVFFSRSFDYHYRMVSTLNTMRHAALGSHDANNCEMAFYPIRDFLIRTDSGLVDHDMELGHHFVTTGIIHIIRMASRFMNKPSVWDYRNIQRWISHPAFLDNICYYRRQSGESRVLHLALRTRLTPVILIADLYRELVLRVKARLGGG